MTAKDAINATATVLSRMSQRDRAAVARVLTMPAGIVESITEQAIYDDVKAIATRSIKTAAESRAKQFDPTDFMDTLNDWHRMATGAK